MGYSVDRSNWTANLLRSKSGSIKPLLANAVMALRDSGLWQGVLCYDSFAMRTCADRAPPWDPGLIEWEPRPWGPQDDLLVTDWLQHQGIGVSTATAGQAVEMVAQERSFHPVRDYLQSIQHDGMPRIGTWLSDYMGVERSKYTDAVGRAMLIGAVARIFEPGCKVDTVPILEAPQGARKSSAIEALFKPWFTDELDDIGSKDCAMQTRGIWGIEISELDAMSRSDVSKIKAFISRTSDRFRPPYGSRVIECLRGSVFWGSTNSEGYLKDETGGRRFWPLRVGRINLDELQAIRDQLWAEAVIHYQASVPWWLSRADLEQEAEAQQRQRYSGDPWDGPIEHYLHTLREASVEDILREAVHLEIGQCGQTEQNRVARIFRALGWQRFQKRSGDKRRWIYRKPVTGGDGDPSIDNVTTLRPVTPFKVEPWQEFENFDETPLSPQSPLIQ
jgi:predicted P-loop ATPase